MSEKKMMVMAMNHEEGRGGMVNAWNHDDNVMKCVLLFKSGPPPFISSPSFTTVVY
jgi:hypothetical protein